MIFFNNRNKIAELDLDDQRDRIVSQTEHKRPYPKNNVVQLTDIISAKSRKFREESFLQGVAMPKDQNKAIYRSDNRSYEVTDVILLEDVIRPGTNEFKEELRTEGHAVQQSKREVKYDLDNYKVIDLTDEVSRNSQTFYNEVKKEGFAYQPGLLEKFYESKGIRTKESEKYKRRLLMIGVELNQKISEKKQELSYQTSIESLYNRLYSRARRFAHKISGKKKRAIKVISNFLDLSDETISKNKSAYKGHVNFWHEPKCVRFSPRRFIDERRKMGEYGRLNLRYI